MKGKHSLIEMIRRIIEYFEPKDVCVLDFFAGFRVIIKIYSNSQVDTRVLELLPKFKIKK